MGDWDDLDLGTGEIPESWLQEDDFNNHINYIDPKYIRKAHMNSERFFFLTFQDAKDFFNKYYIDPIVIDRFFTRSHNLNYGFILKSRYDTKPDDKFDYYIYDPDLKNQYKPYIWNEEDKIIEKVRLATSRKLKISEYGIDERNIDFRYIYAFSLSYFISSNFSSYEELKKHELEKRDKEINLLKKSYHSKWDKYEQDCYENEGSNGFLGVGTRISWDLEAIRKEREEIGKGFLKEIYEELKALNTRSFFHNENEDELLESFIKTTFKYLKP